MASYSCLEINNGIKVILMIKAGHTLLLYCIDHCPNDGHTEVKVTLKHFVVCVK